MSQGPEAAPSSSAAQARAQPGDASAQAAAAGPVDAPAVLAADASSSSSSGAAVAERTKVSFNGIDYETYTDEQQLYDVAALIDKELSEPYSMFTYRHFVNNFPHYCFLASDNGRCVGGIICKVDIDQYQRRVGYIGMLVVDKTYRGKKIGLTLVRLAVRAMHADKADLVYLETECTNKAALALYEQMGFVRTRLEPKYYLNNGDAYRLELWFKPPR